MRTANTRFTIMSVSTSFKDTIQDERMDDDDDDADDLREVVFLIVTPLYFKQAGTNRLQEHNVMTVHLAMEERRQRFPVHLP